MARAAIARARNHGHFVSLLLTLATPHRQPPLPFLPSMTHFYSQLSGSALNGTALVSVYGGRHDVQVSSLSVILFSK